MNPKESMKAIASFCLALAALAVVPLAHADDPSLREVYQAVRDGHLDEAQAMMTRVLRDHPDSAKAHYVQAEVLVRLNRADEARAELVQAERLQPGLPFAKPDAVRDLRTLIAERASHRGPQVIDQGHSEEGSFPWGPVLVFVGAGFVLFLFLRARRASMASAGALAPGAGTAPVYGQAPYPGAPMGGGLGSSIVGGLATGAAVGAGMVAGEALAHEFMGNRGRESYGVDPSTGGASTPVRDDGGAADFGVSDAGSWDSGGGGDMLSDGGGGGGDWS
jgi:uncharacterized protein